MKRIHISKSAIRREVRLTKPSLRRRTISSKRINLFNEMLKQLETDLIKEGCFDDPAMTEYLFKTCKADIVDAIVKVYEIKKSMADIFISYGMDINQYARDYKDKDKQIQLIQSLFTNSDLDISISNESLNPYLHQAFRENPEPTIGELSSFDMSNISEQNIDSDPEIVTLTNDLKSKYRFIILRMRLVYMMNKHRENPQTNKEIGSEVIKTAMLTYIASHPIQDI